LTPERFNNGKVSASERENVTLHFETVDSEQRAELEAILLPDSDSDNEEDEDENEDTSMEEQAEDQALSPPPPYTTGQSVNGQSSLSGKPPTYKRRRLSSSSVEYVPSFLPDFPANGTEATTTGDDACKVDFEYGQERERRLKMGEDKSEQKAEREEEGQGRKEQEAAMLASLEAIPTSRRGTEDNWHSAVDFASSTLATQQSIDDIPEEISEEEEDGVLQTLSQQELGHQVFAKDYLALVAEASSVPPTFLTPSGGGFANAFNQRRALATLLSDPSKYAPCDTIFAAIDVRPTAAPFQPGPSLLITPPTNTTSAPTFTPIRANGRELLSSSTMNNALHPVCRHRVPNNVFNSSRMLSGGMSSEIFRRVTRTQDPIPILDERHAERVFHGIQAPKELLSDANSYLREALDVLKHKRAEELKASIESGSLEEQSQSQFNIHSSRDKLRVKSGTLVQTWDWMGRDYTDAVLPGKKYRTGTSGVLINEGGSSSNNNNKGDEVEPSRRRSESIHMS
jgi:hypothetical protein